MVSKFIFTCTLFFLGGAINCLLVHDLVQYIMESYLAILVAHIYIWIFITKIISNHIVSLIIVIYGLPDVNAGSCTSYQLFSQLDTNNDGIITFSEIEHIIDKSYIPNVNYKAEECSCFRCDGTHFHKAVICDVYDNSGCTNENAHTNCYTTNIKKCECNFYSKNVYMCKIPLTHSFINYNEPSINYNVKMDEENINRRSSHGNMEKRADSLYQNDRRSGIDDMVNMAVGYMIGDVIGTVMSDMLVGKDPY